MVLQSSQGLPELLFYTKKSHKILQLQLQFQLQLQLQFYKGTHTPYNKRAPSIHIHLHVHIQRILHPEIQFYMQKTKSSSSTTTTLQIPDSRNSTHRRQGDLLEMHPCVLQDLPVTFQAFSHKSLQRQLQLLQLLQTFQSFQTFRTFQSFMTFQPFQAILQILHCSSISRDSTPFQHSPIRMHILQFLQILQFDWFPQKLHRVPVEQYKLQTFYRHYILQRKGDVVISVKRASVKMSR